MNHTDQTKPDTHRWTQKILQKVIRSLRRSSIASKGGSDSKGLMGSSSMIQQILPGV